MKLVELRKQLGELVDDEYVFPFKALYISSFRPLKE
jgi:hypothetical protein